MTSSPRCSPSGRRKGAVDGDGSRGGKAVEKRSHPAPTRRSSDRSIDAAAAVAAAAAAGLTGSPVISHLSKGGRFSGGYRESSIILVLPDAADPSCRALVPYTASPARPSSPLRGPVGSLPAPTLLASPPSPARDHSSCRFSRSGVGAGGSMGRRVDIPLEVFPIVFQYMDAPTLCSVSTVSREWRKQGNDDQYWRRLCRARFNVTPDAFAPPPDPIKRLYQLQHGSFKAMCRGCRHGFHTAPPSISRHTSAQLLGLMMMSNAM